MGDSSVGGEELIELGRLNAGTDQAMDVKRTMCAEMCAQNCALNESRS
jgi:hypothetical protein